MQLTVKQARVGADLTQEGMAKALGVHPTTYWKLEKHPEKMSIGLAYKFSQITGVDFSDIIFLDSNSN